MTTVDRGNAIEQAIRGAVDSRLFGEERFLERADLTGRRTGGKSVPALERRMQKLRQGRPLGRLTNVGPDDRLANFFHTRYATPLYNDGLGDEDDFNVTLAVNRQVNQVGPGLGSLKQMELAILYKNVEADSPNTCKFDDETFTTQCNALDIITPAVYNYAIAMIQHRESQRFPETYKKRTPYDYWKDYSIDGVVEYITPMQNRASVFTCGGILVDNSVSSMKPVCTELATMVARGTPKVLNYWGSDVMPGAELYFVIKKFEPSDYSYEYTSGGRIITHHAAKQVASNDSEVNPIRPYQMAFFALPHGGLVPPEYTRYYDEWGQLRYDGLVVKIGRVMEVPLGHVFRESNVRLKPFTGSLPACPLSFYTMGSTGGDCKPGYHYPLRIILKSDDGVMPI